MTLLFRSPFSFPLRFMNSLWSCHESKKEKNCDDAAKNWHKGRHFVVKIRHIYTFVHMKSAWGAFRFFFHCVLIIFPTSWPCLPILKQFLCEWRLVENTLMHHFCLEKRWTMSVAEEGHEAGLKRLKSNEELKIVPFLTYVRSKWKKIDTDVFQPVDVTKQE